MPLRTDLQIRLWSNLRFEVRKPGWGEFLQRKRRNVLQNFHIIWMSYSRRKGQR